MLPFMMKTYPPHALAAFKRDAAFLRSQGIPALDNPIDEDALKDDFIDAFGRAALRGMDEHVATLGLDDGDAHGMGWTDQDLPSFLPAIHAHAALIWERHAKDVTLAREHEKNAHL